jgi:tetratricopeptide (TPR) repeat protein
MTRIVLIASVLVSSMLMTGCGSPAASAPAAVPQQERAVLDQVSAAKGPYVNTLQQLIEYYSKMGAQMKLEWALKEYTAVTEQAKPASSENIAMPTSERDMLEQLASYRQAYNSAMEQLANYYSKSGTSAQLSQTRDQIAAVRATQYSYVVEAQVAGPDMRAMASVPAANTLYEAAVAKEKEARNLVGVNEKELRQALGMFDQLIREYPTSDKIGVAAWKAGQAYEDLSDYALAALYYERAAQWDKNLPYPARFRAAYMYDKYLNDRPKALTLYKDSLNHEFMNSQYRAYAYNRVIDLGKKELK